MPLLGSQCAKGYPEVLVLNLGYGNESAIRREEGICFLPYHGQIAIRYCNVYKHFRVSTNTH